MVSPAGFLKVQVPEVYYEKANFKKKFKKKKKLRQTLFFTSNATIFMQRSTFFSEQKRSTIRATLPP